MDYTKAIVDQATANIKNGVGTRFAQHALDTSKSVHPLHAPYIGGKHTIDPGTPSPAVNMGDRSMKPSMPPNRKASSGTTAKPTAHAVSGGGD